MAFDGIPRASLPADFNGTLRSYQVRGVDWLVLLRELELGALLADDMGLGKTVQALALLLHRSARGPALVIAPTSVCGGWARESWRFSPTLRVVQFGSGDRKAELEGLGPGDLVITSDIPLAARVIEAGSTVVRFRGEQLTAANVRQRLQARDFMEELRGSGVMTGGPPPFGPKDKQRFAGALDRWLAAASR